MKALFRPLFLGVLAGTLFFFTACDSKTDVWPTVITPQTGNLSGQVLPAFAATSVVARSQGNEMTVVPDENGNYLFKNINAGKWQIFFTPAPGYDHNRTHETEQVYVGSTTKALPGFLNLGTAWGGWWQMEGSFNPICSIVSSYQANRLSVSFANGTQNMSLSLGGMETSPLSFPLGNASHDSQITFQATSTAGVTQQWTTVGGSGTVEVSVYATNPRRISGTFTCLAKPANSSTAAPKEITGRFVNIRY